MQLNQNNFSNEIPFLEFDGIRFEKEKISNIQDGRAFLQTKRPDIALVYIKHGFLAHRPILQSIFGVTLILPGIYALYYSILSLINGAFSRYQICFAFLFFLGLWIVYDALKRGYYLEIQLKTGYTKMTFHKKKSKSELNQLIKEVKNKIGYEISFRE